MSLARKPEMTQPECLLQARLMLRSGAQHEIARVLRATVERCIALAAVEPAVERLIRDEFGIGG